MAFSISFCRFFSSPKLFYISPTCPPLSSSSHRSTVLNNNDAFILDRQERGRGRDERETQKSNGKYHDYYIADGIWRVNGWKVKSCLAQTSWAWRLTRWTFNTSRISVVLRIGICLRDKIWKLSSGEWGSRVVIHTSHHIVSFYINRSISCCIG